MAEEGARVTTSIADSSAVLEPERLLTQHQAALTLLQGMLGDPSCPEVPWLDLACGRGQIILHLEGNLSEGERQKIRLVGYDIENSYSREAKRIAESMGFASYSFEVGALNRFWESRATSGPWRFITLTNAAHELHPSTLAEILVRCIERLDEKGCLFLYDMERLPEPELGAIPWSAAEIREILTAMFVALGVEKYKPSVGRWPHRSCVGWNAQVQASHLDLPDGFASQIPAAIEATAERIRELLRAKIQHISATLASLAEHGAETDEEASEKVHLLYDFWAVSKALGDTT
jgi:hypothetical protein